VTDLKPDRLSDTSTRLRSPVVPVSRHGAISRELTKYASYKSWAEKVRGTFAAESDETPNGKDSGTSRR
jgi:hypothetical protein